MKAWRLHGAGAPVALEEVPKPLPRSGAVVVKMEAAPVLSYMRQVVDGTLGYAVPAGPFVPGTNGVGVLDAVGEGVYHLHPGERVALNPHHLANERVRDPAQILIGLTAIGSGHSGSLDAPTKALQADWRDGVFAEYAHLPASSVTPLPGLGDLPAERLAALAKFVVPYGGFLRGKLLAGETVIVNGATGYFGSAAVLLAVAMGAARVVAAGRDRDALRTVVESAGSRAAAVNLTGEAVADGDRLRQAADGGADLALDLVGRAKSSASTIAALHALRRGGRLVLMGSMSEPLPIAVGEMLANDWTVVGNFMYPSDAPARLAAMVRGGLLDLERIRVRAFPLEQLEAAMEAAANMRSLDLTVLRMR
jgi:alcohol dehydrogenase